MHISKPLHPAMKSCVIKTILLALLTSTGIARAGGFYISADTGYADPSEGSFDSAPAYRFSGGYLFGKVGLEVATVNLDRMEYDGLSDSYIKINGYSAHVYLHHKFNRVLGMDLGAGVFAWDADATFLGFDAGSDTGTGDYIDIRLLTDIGDTFSIYGAARNLSDVSGSDIVTFSAGMAVRF